MIVRIIGMVLIFTSASALGFGAAMRVRTTRNQLQGLDDALGMMACELRYAMTTLPGLCGAVANVATGAIGELFRELSRALCRSDLQSPEAAMREAIDKTKRLCLPQNIIFCLLELGQNLGQFDVEGQLAVIEQSRQRIRACLSQYAADAPQRCKSYRTLGICAGMALVILML